MYFNDIMKGDEKIIAFYDKKWNNTLTVIFGLYM